MTWRVAFALDTLRDQLNHRAPDRDKAADGAIGDADHAARTSDHNPWVGPAPDGKMLVTARDYTHDPAGGLDCHWLARVLVASGDRRRKYIIWDRRIWTPAAGWQPYSGANAHTHHLHLSVSSTVALADDSTPWNLGEDDDMNQTQADHLRDN